MRFETQVDVDFLSLFPLQEEISSVEASALTLLLQEVPL